MDRRTRAVLCLASVLIAAGCQQEQTAATPAEPSPVVLASAPAVDATVTKTRVPILMYHHIKDRTPDAGAVVLRYSVSPAAFDAQMGWLHDNGFTSITFQQLADHIAHGTPLPTKPVIISLDDGWSCGYFAAFKSLRAHDLVATYFVYPGGINAGNPGGYISWDQLREMADAGMEIAAHTMSHPYLTQLPDDKAWAEISQSKNILEQRLGRPVFSLAYPYGDYNDKVMDLTRRAGYICGISTDPGDEHGPGELFRLCRIIVTYDESLDAFARDVTAWSTAGAGSTQKQAPAPATGRDATPPKPPPARPQT